MKQKHQVGALLVLMVIAAFVWLWNFRKPVVTADQSIMEGPIITVENPQIRMDLIDKARKSEYKSISCRNPFSPGPCPQQHVVVAPKPHEIVGPQQEPMKPPPPPPTLGNIKFYGFGTLPNSAARRAFLTDGESIYVVAEGEILVNRFRILRIGNASLEFEEIASGRRGTAPYEEQAAGPQP